MKKIKLKQIKSIINRPKTQKLIIKALGLGKINKIKEHSDSPHIWGMINKVKHLIQVYRLVFVTLITDVIMKAFIIKRFFFN